MFCHANVYTKAFQDCLTSADSETITGFQTLFPHTDREILWRFLSTLYIWESVKICSPQNTRSWKTPFLHPASWVQANAKTADYYSQHFPSSTSREKASWDPAEPVTTIKHTSQHHLQISTEIEKAQSNLEEAKHATISLPECRTKNPRQNPNVPLG